MAWPAKDPAAILDYSWAPGLDEGDTIAAHAATIVSGTVAKVSDSHTNTTVTIKLSGGADGEAAVIRLSYTTAGGRSDERDFALQIINQASAFAMAFIAAFPAFASVDAGAVAFWHARAVGNAAGYGDDREYGEMLWTAHYLTLQGLGTGGEAQRNGEFGGATSIKSGTLSLGWEGGGRATEGLRSTSYGRLLWPLLRAYGGGPLVTGTGTVDFVREGYPHGYA